MQGIIDAQRESGEENTELPKETANRRGRELVRRRKRSEYVGLFCGDAGIAPGGGIIQRGLSTNL
jgi:hypothetical protein